MVYHVTLRKNGSLCLNCWEVHRWLENQSEPVGSSFETRRKQLQRFVREIIGKPFERSLVTDWSMDE